MKKLFLYISIGVIFLAIPITVFVVGKNTEVRKRAAPASTLSFSPPSQTVKAGDKFTLDVKLNTATNQVALVQLRIVYDPAYLEAEEITNGPLAPSIRASKKIDANGKVSISVGAKDSTHPITGTGTIAILSMKAIKASATPVSIKFTPSPDTVANGIGEGQNDVIIGRSPASITVNNADGTEAKAEAGAAPPPPTSLQAGGGATTTPAPTPSPTPVPSVTPSVITFGGSGGFTFAPSQVTVKTGQPVIWKGDFAAHPLISVDNLWTTVQTGTEFTHTFTAAGTYTYYCQAHGNQTSGMKGQITVVAADLASAPPQASPSALIITSPTNNEGVTTETPVIKGKGTPGSTITLTIHSEPQTVVVSVDENGNWIYTPQTPLEAGPHTITALITDPVTGETQTATATFVVTATGGTDVSSGSAIPVSGNAQLTIMLIAVGMLLLVSGALMPLVLQ